MAVYRIHQPAKTAMQSGRAKSRLWVLEPMPSARVEAEPLMGWQASRDTEIQVRLEFATVAEAESYAQKRGLQYRVDMPPVPTVKPKSYAEKFLTPPPAN